MAYVPRVNPIVGGSNWYGGRPGIVTVNFDPLDPANAEFTENLADGTLIIQYGAQGEDVDGECTQECAVSVSIKACSDCDTPILTALFNAAPTAYTANGAIALPTGGNTTVLISKPVSLAALTLAAPVGVPDGTTVTYVSTTAFAHTVTQAAPGFNGGGGGSDVATFGAAVGNSFGVVASGGVWYTTFLNGVTLG